MTPIPPDEIRARIARVPWYQSIELGGGISTAGHPAKDRVGELHLPDMAGKTVLDIGAWSGFWTFYAEQHGAIVTALDKLWQEQPEHMLAFLTAREALGSRCRMLVMPAEDLRPEIGTWDVVLLLQVIYHVGDPLRLIRAVRSVCRQMCVVETLVDADQYPRPAVVYCRANGENAEDSVNDHVTCYPNEAALRLMFTEAGFSQLVKVGQYGDGRISDALGSKIVRAAFHAIV